MHIFRVVNSGREIAHGTVQAEPVTRSTFINEDITAPRHLVTPHFDANPGKSTQYVGYFAAR